MSNNNKTSLWKLLAKHDIVVPIIQRDYAQGRKGKEDLRSRFLSSLLKSLEDEEEIKLDFVYGGVENNQMMPLDGQQRLTTLWLLHWYIAFRANKLKDREVCKRLKKFYYATRPSSTEFCRRLVDEFCKVEDSSKISGVVEYIKNQHWYYSYYNNDPTIQAILMMIEGDRSKDEKNGLEQFFDGSRDFNNDWEKLIGEACPIQFYHQDMIGDDMPLVDDLYIKMNARGKQLTNFENFKAELIGYNNDFKLDIVKNENDKQFVSNLDNSWMNIFWPYKKDGYNRVDEIYYRFINQVMLNYYLINNSNKMKVGDKEIEIDKMPLYTLLENGSKFNKIEDYECVLVDDFKNMLFHTLNGIEKCARKVENKDMNEYLKEKLGYYLSFSNTIDFIPQYKSKDVYEDQDNLPTTTLGQIPQVIFFAICRFFEKWDTEQSEWEEETCVKLQDWVRFCYNICYNPLVNTVNGMQGALKVIYEISNKLCCLDIYGSLCELESFDNISLESKVARDQIEEEFYKAKYQKDNDELKQEFIEAEKYSFFKGCIRFMLWNEEKEYVGTFVGTLFKEKYKRAQELFSNEDTLEGKIHNKDCFAQYLCACTKLENIISNDNNGNGCIRFNNSGEAWKSMLANTSLCDVTHRFLCKQIQSKEDLINLLSENIIRSDIVEKDMEIKRMNYVIETLLEDNFMKHLESLDAIVSGVLFLRKNYEWALYPKNAKADRKVIVLGTSRNKVLKQLLNNTEFQTPYHVEKSSLFFGWNIPFKYGDKDFIWKWNHQIEYKNDNDEVNNLFFSFDTEYNEIIEILNGILSPVKH